MAPDNQCYSRYEPGLAISAVPFYWLAHTLVGSSSDPLIGSSIQQLIVSTFSQVVMAGTCALVFLFALHISGSRRHAIEIALLFGITTLAWPYASLFLSQPLVGLLLLAAVFLLVSSDRNSYLHTLIAGVALGWACLVRMDTVVLVAVIAIYLFYQLRRLEMSWQKTINHLGLIAFPVIITITLYGLQNQMRSGTPFQWGYPGEGWTTPFTEGLYGLLFSPGKGLVFFSPVMFLAIIGLVGLWKKGWEAEVALIGGLTIAQLAIYSPWWAWDGGWTWGPRFLVSTQALLVLGLVTWLENKKGRLVVAVAATLGFLVQVIGATTDTMDYMKSSDFSNSEVLFRPEASQIIGQLGNLLERRVYLVVATQANGLLSQSLP